MAVAVPLSLLILLIAATSISAEEKPTELGTCNPYKSANKIEQNLCIHIIKLREKIKNLKAHELCLGFNARLPEKDDASAVYKRLYWNTENPGEFTSFFAVTSNVNAVGYKMGSVTDTNNLILDQNTLMDQIICIRERMPKLTCPPAFTFIEQYRACYLYDTKNARDHAGCSAFCRGKGGYPVVFDSFDQFLWLLRNFFKDPHPSEMLENGYWSGHFIPNDFPQELGWNMFKGWMRERMYTVDGSPAWIDPAFWRPDEPNAGGRTGKSEHCIEFWPKESARFNDYFCTHKIRGCACRAIPDQTQSAFI